MKVKKCQRRTEKRLAKRITGYNDSIKRVRNPQGYRKPGSMKMRTN